MNRTTNPLKATRRALIPLAIFVLLAGTALAHHASIHGKVLDASGKAVSGAAVELFNGAESIGKATTDAKGAFKIAGLDEGSFRLVIKKSGFADAAKDVKLDEGTATVEIRLTAASKK